MIMAMVKSAARMGSAKAAGLPALLSDLNSVLLSVSASNLFVTFACIAGTAGNRVQFALAGHLPILHYRKRLETVEERGVENLPLAILPHAEFTAAEIECEEGDVLAVLTDGLTETSDAMERELGLEPLKQTLARTSGNSLAQIAAELRKVSLQHGSQVDDQTVLLVSYCKNTH
jgi:serine phosphatase RsbU (regulator of sigma subunit)